MRRLDASPGNAPAGPMLRALAVAASAAVLAFSVLPATGVAATAATKTVDIRQFAFAPKEITVEPGTRIVWTNHDETPHTVTSSTTPKVLASPGMDTDDHFEFTFEKEGDFAYLCTIHPMMTGVVHVHRSATKGR